MLETLLVLAALQQAGATPLAGEADKDLPKVHFTATNQPITEIEFVGTDAPEDVADAAKAFIGKPNSKQVLAELVGTLTRAYETSPVALYTVAIPEQDFAGGVVKVLLTEAAVEAVEIDGDGRYSRLAGLANRMVGEKPLSRATYERQVSLMRAIPGVKFDLAMDNPDLDDDVTITLNPTRKRVEGAIGVNNRGPDLIGDVVTDGRLDFNSLLVDGDRFRFSSGATVNPKRFRQFGANYDAPIGLSGLTASSSLAFVRTRAKGIDLDGKARVAQFALTYPLLRTFHRAADVSLALDGVNSRNALFGNVISSDKVRTLRGAAGYSSLVGKDRLQGSLIISKGLDILGARVDPIVSEVRFLKINASVSYEREIARRVIGRTTAMSQWSGDRLPASELFSIGGPTVGRAFDTALLSGDRGYGGVAEIAFRPIAAGKFSKSELYIYGDGAKVGIERRGDFPTQHYGLASAGVGARAKWNDKVDLGAEVGRVLDKPYPGYDQKWRVSVAYRLSL